MVPLRLDVCEDRAYAADRQARPRLVLKDLTAEQASPVRRQPSPLSRLENVFLAAAAAAVLLYFFLTFAFSLVHTVQQSYTTLGTPSVVMIAHSVKHGDTLSGLAKRYGDPSTYILAREEAIARANNLSGTTPLVPGQHLRIPVTNPTVIAQIEQNTHHGLVASR